MKHEVIATPSARKRVDEITTPVGRFWFGADPSNRPVAGWSALEPRPAWVAPAPAAWDLRDRLRAYFEGHGIRFDDLPLPTSKSPFAAACWDALRRSPPGSVTTYGRLASQVGRPAAARAVGNAMRTNPAPVLVPCHRVLAASGLGGYSGSRSPRSPRLAVKRFLLELEADMNAGCLQ